MISCLTIDLFQTFCRANAKLAEANTQLYYERHKNKSLLANSFISGSLSSTPVLETVQMGNLGNNLALNKSLNLGGGFLNTNGTALASKNRMEAYLAKVSNCECHSKL